MTENELTAFQNISAAFELEIQRQEALRKQGTKGTIEEELTNNLKDFADKFGQKVTVCNHCDAVNQELNTGACGRCGKYSRAIEVDGDEDWTNRAA